METKNTLTEFLMTDLDLIHDLHDIIDSEEINDTINILNSLRFQIFHTCDIVKDIAYRPDSRDILYIINDNIMGQSQRNSFLFNEVYVSVKENAKKVFHEIKGKEYKTILQILLEDDDFMIELEELEDVPMDNIERFLTENLDDIILYAFEDMRKHPKKIFSNKNYKFILNFINNGIIIIDDITDELKNSLDILLGKLRNFILTDVHYRSAENLDYSSLYVQTVNEFEATINWLNSCHIKYEIKDDKKMNQKRVIMKSWDKDICLFDQYEGIVFDFNKETNEMVKVNSYS